jgi:Raf kinase inhibitor-like YbhB/YbcL family protein
MITLSWLKPEQMMNRLNSMARHFIALGSLGPLLAGCSGHSPTLIDRSETDTTGVLKVYSSSFPAGGIPVAYTGYESGDHVKSPGEIPMVTWSSPPAGSKEMVLLVEDPDAPGSEPFVHWLVLGMPGNATRITGGARLGKNSENATSYYPPKPPPGQVHHYHFEVFALDEQMAPTVDDRNTLLSAIKGHVLAKGELIATYRKL